jgi:hypothetical protein
MLRLISAASAVFFTVSAAAYAADPQIIVTPDSNAQTTHEKIVAAAKTVCATAIKHDSFGDFGTPEECIATAVQNARPVGVADQAQSKTLAQRTN